MRRRVTAVAVLVGLLWTIVPAAAAQAAEPVSGSGSTWAQNALDQWIQDFRPGHQPVSFSGIGSAAGRGQFRTGQADFAVSDLEYLDNDNGVLDPPPTDRGFTYLPVLGNGLALTYNLRTATGTPVTNLRLSGDTAAKIFTGQITRWNDLAIRADNPRLALPAQTITPVVRGDRTASSMVLTRWLADRHPALWTDYCARTGQTSCVPSAFYPSLPGMSRQSGADRVAGYVASSFGSGSIGYVEYPYVLARALPAVNLRNEAGSYVAPTAAAVSSALAAAAIRPDQTQDLAPVFANPDPSAYPLSSYGYAIVPTDTRLGFTTGRGETLAAFLRHAVGPGQSVVDTMGYAPLPPNLVSAALAQIDRIPGALP